MTQTTNETDASPTTCYACLTVALTSDQITVLEVNLNVNNMVDLCNQLKTLNYGCLFAMLTVL